MRNIIKQDTSMPIQISELPKDFDDAFDFLIKHIRERANQYFTDPTRRLYSSHRESYAKFFTALDYVMKNVKLPQKFKTQFRQAADPKNIESKGGVELLRLAAEYEMTVFELRLKEHFSRTDINSSFKLDSNEINRINELTSEMKMIVLESAFFDKDHKIRLLNRIAQIESEVLKSKGNFDVILAGVVEFGDALGQFGKKVKPLTDRMREVRFLIQKRASGHNNLPPPEEPKMLPPPDDVANIEIDG